MRAALHFRGTELAQRRPCEEVGSRSPLCTLVGGGYFANAECFAPGTCGDAGTCNEGAVLSVPRTQDAAPRETCKTEACFNDGIIYYVSLDNGTICEAASGLAGTCTYGVCVTPDGEVPDDAGDDGDASDAGAPMVDGGDASD